MENERLFEWDEAKATGNFAKHAVEFDFAIRVFLDPLRADFDVTRETDGEVRREVVGDVDGEIFTFVYTMRAAITRVISARRSNVKEDRIHAPVRS